MIDVHLIGYTADLRHIVLDLDPGQHRGRYRLEIDLDLFLTLDEIRERRRAAGLEAGPRLIDMDEVQEAVVPAKIEFSDAGDDRMEDDEADADTASDVPHAREDGGEGNEPAQVAPDTHTAGGHSPSRGAELQVPPPAHEPGEMFSPIADSEWKGETDGAAASPQPESRLTPAEIQALLRAGRSLKTVAKLAGIGVSRVERWLPPILAERAQVLQEAHATPLGSSAGYSRQPLAAAVTRNLSLRGTDLDGVSWTAHRRVDGRWTVQLRYRQGNRSRCASWSFDRREQTLTAGSQLAQELGWSDDPVDREEDGLTPSSLNGPEAGDDDQPAEGASPDAVQGGEAF